MSPASRRLSSEPYTGRRSGYGAAGDEEVAYAMQSYFPDTDIATLSAVAKSYRATDSWTRVPTMTEDAFTRLQDILDGAGELAARIELSELVDNSFGEAAISEIG